MNSKERKIIIVPDVHGRTFWKPVVEYVKEHSNAFVVFLGDYLDPYPWEGITKEDAIANFEEILDFKDKFPDNVLLLLGNHDFGPYISDDMPACRTDYKHLDDIRAMFHENMSKFSLIWYTEQDGQKFLFSHSCLLKKWIEYVNTRQKYDKLPKIFKKPANIPDIADTLNKALSDNIDSIIAPLGTVSRSRGGRYPYGSFIWAHWDELTPYSYEFRGWYQVFGHSQRISYEMEKEIYANGYTDKLAEPIIDKYFACLDCKQLFTIENGKIVKFIPDRI